MLWTMGHKILIVEYSYQYKKLLAYNGAAFKKTQCLPYATSSQVKQKLYQKNAGNLNTFTLLFQEK